MNKILLILIIILSACASSWKRDGVPYSDQEWRFCQEEKDGKEFARNGFCYIDRECKKTLFKKKCRPVKLFCAWGDIDCMIKYKFFEKVIKK